MSKYILKSETVKMWGLETAFSRYDNRGNVIYERNEYGDELYHEYDEYDNPILTKYPNGEVITYEHTYNEHNDVIYTITSTGKELHCSYNYDNNGNLIYMHTNVKEVKITYDERGRIVHAEECIDGVWEPYDFTYDDNGNLIYAKYPDGVEHFYEYDSNNNCISEKSSDNSINKTCSYTYDDNDNIICRIESSGLEIRYTYDDNNNKISQRRSDGIETIYEYTLIND